MRPNIFQEATDTFDFNAPSLGAVPLLSILGIIKGGIDRQIQLSTSIDQARQVIQQKADAINQAKRHLAELEKELLTKGKLNGWLSNALEDINATPDESKASVDAKVNVEPYIPSPAILVIDHDGKTIYGRQEIRKYLDSLHSSVLRSKTEAIKWYLGAQQCWIGGRKPHATKINECMNLPAKRVGYNKGVLEDHIKIGGNQDRILQAMMAYAQSLEGKVDTTREEEFQIQSLLSNSSAIKASVTNVGLGIAALLGIGLLMNKSKNTKTLKPVIK